MIELVYMAPWLNNGGYYVFFCFDVSIQDGNGRVAIGAFGFLIGVIFHNK